MRDIIPGRVWLGNAGDGREPERLLRAGIVAVVTLAVEEPSTILPREMICCRFPLVDGVQDDDSILVVAIQTISLLLRNGIPTLVCCSAGMSRSPAVLAAALALAEGGSVEERLQQIALGQPHDVSPPLWQAVRRVWNGLANGRFESPAEQ